MNKFNLQLLSISLLTLSFICSASSPVQVEPVLNNYNSVDYGSSISPDGKKMYYTHVDPDSKLSKLMVATLKEGKVVSSEPLIIGGEIINGGDVQISPDGTTLMFCSGLTIGRDESRKDQDLFYATKTENGWSAAKRFPETINSESSEFYPILTHSGNLYFARTNKETSIDLYVSQYVNGNYLPAKRLGDHINTHLLESDAYISPDESFMVFVRMNEQGAHGVSDLYVSFNKDQQWTIPVNLAKPFNFAGVDGSPFVTQDKKWLYFTSNRDAPEPSKFDGYLGLFRIPFLQVLTKLDLAATQELLNDAPQEKVTKTKS